MIACSANTSNNKGNLIQTSQKRDYRLIIDDVITRFSLGKTVSLDELMNAVPTTKEEFSIYYSYTYPDKGKSKSESFYKVDNEIGKNATNNKGGFLKLYLELSSFVDGEYAESYYEDVDFIISKNKEIFCGLYKGLSSSSRKKLEDYYLQYCK